MTTTRTLPWDWYAGTVPENARLDEGAYLESSYSFLLFRSELAEGVRIGRGSAERVIALGGSPRPLRRERPQRTARIGPVRLWSLGNPAVTLAQAALSALVGPDEPAESSRTALDRRSSSRSTSPSTSVR